MECKIIVSFIGEWIYVLYQCFQINFFPPYINTKFWGRLSINRFNLNARNASFSTVSRLVSDLCNPEGELNSMIELVANQGTNFLNTITIAGHNIWDQDSNRWLAQRGSLSNKLLFGLVFLSSCLLIVRNKCCSVDVQRRTALSHDPLRHFRIFTEFARRQ